MSYARPARPSPAGGTAGRDPAGESTTPADVARGLPRTGGGAATAGGSRPDTADLAPRATPRGRMSGPDWERAGTLGAGILIGALLGAGAALLLAPMSGEDTRRLIAKRARTVRDDAGDRWGDLREELRAAARRRRRALRRGVTRGKWAVADLVDE